MEAMQSQSVDVIKRMKEITLVMQTPEHVLEAQGVTSADIEGTISKSPLVVFELLLFLGFEGSFVLHTYLMVADMLDELQEHVESIDMANGEFSFYLSKTFLLV